MDGAGHRIGAWLLMAGMAAGLASGRAQAQAARPPNETGTASHVSAGAPTSVEAPARSNAAISRHPFGRARAGSDRGDVTGRAAITQTPGFRPFTGFAPVTGAAPASVPVPAPGVPAPDVPAPAVTGAVGAIPEPGPAPAAGAESGLAGDTSTQPVAADPAAAEEDYIVGDTNLPALVPSVPGAGTADDLVGLKYEALDVEEVLSQYAVWTGRALMRAPDVPAAKITLKCPKRIPKREALLAIEGVLAMHGVGLVPLGENFLKVVQITAARQSGMATEVGPLDPLVADTDHLVSRIVELKHLEMAEAQNTIQNLLQAYGKIIPLERVNCLLITESANNLKRILEILALIDQPLESREDLRIFPILHAKASEIQSKIEAIIADVQARDARETARSRFVRQQLAAARLPQPFQPLQPGQAPGAPQPTVVDVNQPALERGLIQSKVKMVADDRINSLIVITRPEQFPFFDNIIKALDQQVEPDLTIKVFSLEYADAEEVVTVLNNLLSESSRTDTRVTPPVGARQPTATRPGMPAASRPTTTRTSGRDIQISGKLTADVKIIADKRINSLLVMATRSDMGIIEDVLRQIDIMLSQVLIEVVIVEIGLTDRIKVGIDWLQRSMIAYNAKQAGGRSAFLGFGGASRLMPEGDGTLADGASINRIADLPAGAGSGLTYYFTHFDFNIDAVINMLAASTEARILSTPIILTTDNKEAKIMVGEKRPIVTSTSISSGLQQSSYQYQDIGIQLEVTPRINKKGFVVMDIKQKIDNKGEDVIIDGNKVPVITTRDFNASIAVNDGRTIVIGGIVSDDASKSRNKVPFLGDIPLLGLLFRSDSKENIRRELVVLMTPYVLDTPEKAYAETARRHEQIAAATNAWSRGWSSSSLSGAGGVPERRGASSAGGGALYKSRELESPPARAP